MLSNGGERGAGGRERSAEGKSPFEGGRGMLNNYYKRLLMKTLILLTSILLLFSCKEKKNDLIWSDEFDYTGLPD